jgi:indole-3-glycerol phosphate synthase
MTNVLTKIIDDKKRHIAAMKTRKTLEALEMEAEAAPAIRPFYAALHARQVAGKTALITEIKKASPSAGLIRPHFDPAELAKTYEKAGASCLSVLTDEPYFQGRDMDLVVARKACHLPVLRKDFMIDPYQIIESRALGADCILIIMACLSDAQARELIATADAYSLSILVEVHDTEELARALPLTEHLPSHMIGINNRNLKTLEIDLATTERLAALTPQNRLMVGESGIRTRADVERLQHANVSCFLVGENLLKSPDVETATRGLLG